MATADEILRNLAAQSEEHIVIGFDRRITVPNSLKRIAVQHDHNIETVTFDCPRYWDDHDMSKMIIYINYILPNGTLGSYIAENITVENDIMHFTWTIMNNLTQVKGNITFLVCIKKTDGEGNETNHWNSERCTDMYVSEGLEVEGPSFVEVYSDMVTQLLTRMTAVEQMTVTTDKIADGAITKNKIAKNAVSADSIPDSSITLTKLSEDVKEKLSGVIKRQIVENLPSDDGVLLHSFGPSPTAYNPSGQKVLVIGWWNNGIANLGVREKGSNTHLRFTLNLKCISGVDGFGLLTVTLGKKAAFWSEDIRREWTSGSYQFDIDMTAIASWDLNGIEGMRAVLYGADSSSLYSASITDARIIDTTVIDIDEHTIYMVPAEEEQSNNIYNEFMYINRAWEQIGSTSVDLSGFYTKEEEDQTHDELRRLITDNIGYVEGSSIQIQTGTFTPMMTWDRTSDYTDSMPNSASGEGTYYRIGNLVYVSVHIEGLAWYGGEPNLKFTGLPFEAADSYSTAVFVNTYEDNGEVYDGSFQGSGIVRTVKDSTDMQLYKLNHDTMSSVDKITSLGSSSVFKFAFNLTYFAKN